MINHRYRYVIEIDGSYHDRKDQRRRDKIKNLVFRRRGYEVFRVMAFEPLQLEALAECIERHRDR